jgi:hypothetical protein
MSFWCNIKRGRCWVDIYYKGEKIASVKVDEKNVGNRSCISLDAHPDAKLKIVKTHKEDDTNSSEDESKFNKEEYNR